jgi:hypothetical protein
MSEDGIFKLVGGIIIGAFIGALLMAIQTDEHLQARNTLQTHVDQQIKVGNAFYDPKTAELRVAVCGESGLFHPPAGQLEIN